MSPPLHHITVVNEQQRLFQRRISLFTRGRALQRDRKKNQLADTRSTLVALDVAYRFAESSDNLILTRFGCAINGTLQLRIRRIGSLIVETRSRGCKRQRQEATRGRHRAPLYAKSIFNARHDAQRTRRILTMTRRLSLLRGGEDRSAANPRKNTPLR